MKRCYREKTFNAEHTGIIDTANEIIAEYTVDGLVLTLRQLYYQFVARDLIPNTSQSYNRLGAIISAARYAGRVDWSALEDRTRFKRENSHWGSPAEILSSCASQFQYDKWADQDIRPEVWIEKDALLGVIERTCRDLDVPFFSCRGYPSASAIHEAADRISDRANQDEQRTQIIHLGDHDPSGIDMTRDIRDRLAEFVEHDAGPEYVPDIHRIALTMDQVDEFGPPPNPAKITDSRAGAYIEEFGYESWELDALNPATLDRLIREAVGNVRDEERYEAQEDRETDARARLQDVSDNWEDDEDDDGES